MRGSRNKLSHARNGDRGALGELLDRHEARLRALARLYRGQGLRADLHTSDLLQATYVDVLGSVEQFEGSTDEAFGKWLRRILENNVRDGLKYHGAEKRARQRDDYRTALEDLYWSVLSSKEFLFNH